jgi:glycosyltransferase involved in cell wall biosynthesis
MLVVPRMDQLDRHILLDTYNLRLRTGSGIKTYGRALFETLTLLGARISLLTDRPAQRAKRDDLAEVLLFDTPQPPRFLRRQVRRVRAAVGGTVGSVRPRLIEPRHVIPDEILSMPGPVTGLHNAPRIYEYAHARYKRLRRLTPVRLERRVDVWHATTPLPIRVAGAQMVTTVHDLIPLRLPYTTLDDKRMFYEVTRRAVRESALVLAISESTKRDLQDFFDVPDERIAVTYQSLPSALPAADPALACSTLDRFGVRAREYLLFVGNIEPKKNVRTVIEALGMLPREIKLIVVGRKAWLWRRELEAAERFLGPTARERLILTGFVPDTVLGALYANALCLVFPSLYEGFGLPPLEAMRQGCPVITSSVASLPEVCGDAALYVEPREAEQIRHHVEHLRQDEALREHLVREGHGRVDRFSLERYAERLREAYAKIGASAR